MPDGATGMFLRKGTVCCAERGLVGSRASHPAIESTAHISRRGILTATGTSRPELSIGRAVPETATLAHPPKRVSGQRFCKPRPGQLVSTFTSRTRFASRISRHFNHFSRHGPRSLRASRMARFTPTHLDYGVRDRPCTRVLASDL